MWMDPFSDSKLIQNNPFLIAASNVTHLHYPHPQTVPFTGSQMIVGKHDDSIIHIEYSEETDQAIAAGLDKKLMFWDTRMQNGNFGCTKMIDSDVWSLSLSGIHLLVATGTKVNIYDLRNLKGPIQSEDSSTKYQILCVRSFPRCQGYAVGSIDGCVALKYSDPSIECEKGYLFRCHPKSKDGSSYVAGVNDIQFHPFNDTFVTGDNEGYAIIWNGKSRKRLFELGRFPNSVASLSYNQSGSLMAIASSPTYHEEKEVQEVPHIFIRTLEG